MKIFSLFITLLLTTTLLSQHYTSPPSVENPDKRKPLNIDHMLRGHFYASSPWQGKYAGYGGWGGSSNDYHSIWEVDLPDPGVGIIADPNAECSFWDISLGMKVFLYNTTPDTVFFSAQDSRLYMTIQAQDSNMQWKDIEYLPSSWCGNSCHTLYLPPDSYWEFDAPVFEGKMKTSMRIKASYRSEFESEESISFYSREYPGSVNPRQFTNKEEYTPGGLMDPYID
jgi:hypothetical protein